VTPSKTAASGPRLCEVPTAEVSERLRGRGLDLHVGALTVRVRSDAPALAAQIQAAYGQFPARHEAPWVDLHLDVALRRRWHRWWRPQVDLWHDGRLLFEPFAAESPLPLLEWGMNWLIARTRNDLLLLHAAVVERNGLALVMPALPGSGKSTLSAALGLSGWRLLSDEFGALDLEQRRFRAMLKPAALKNESIAVIGSFAQGRARFGPSFPGTRKGTVAHLAAPADAVDRVDQGAEPGCVLLPRWKAGSPTVIEAIAPSMAFSQLAYNAFNYAVAGADGFEAIVDLSERCRAWQLVYSDLDDAVRTLDARWPELSAPAGA
jgi:HprK-related kinase A